MALSRRLQTLAAGMLAATILLLDAPVRAQDNVPPVFGPPLQYTSKPGHEFDALLAANVSWLKSKLTDRKRRRREAQNSFRLEPAATKPQVQAVIDLLDKEVKETEAAFAVVKARPPDPAAVKQVVKTNVEAWIKALNDRAQNYRKYAEEAEAKAKGAAKQLDAARYRLDVDDDKQIADKAEQEAKALSADLKAAGL
ncbi:MAG TPA: hypothetical protein VN917_02120 [Xanthobacteraceae bacterium]|nr:hypothetical protein [Xanthobacteraceae bacterium]